MEDENLIELLKFMSACNVIAYEEKCRKSSKPVFRDSGNISGLFMWDESPQGYDYWHNIAHGKFDKNDYSKFID